MTSKPKYAVPAPWYSLSETLTEPAIPYITLPPIPGVTTPLHIASFTRRDAPALQRILSNSIVNLALVSPPWPYTLADADWWISHILTGEGGELGLQVIRAGSPTEGELIGSVCLTPYKIEESEYVLGYWLAPEFHGKGIMKMAALAMLSWAKETGQAKSVVVQVIEDNFGSRKIVESIQGFEPILDESGERKVDLEAWQESKGGGEKRLFSWRITF